MTLADKQRALIEDFAIVADRHERLSLVVDRSRRAAPLAASEKNASTRVPGCVSPVWLVGELRDGRLHLRIDAESPMVKGLVALLCELYDGGQPADIVATEPTFFDALDLTRDLSPTRRNGLAAVRARIKSLAQLAL